MTVILNAMNLFLILNYLEFDHLDYSHSSHCLFISNKNNILKKITLCYKTLSTRLKFWNVFEIIKPKYIQINIKNMKLYVYIYVCDFITCNVFLPMQMRYTTSKVLQYRTFLIPSGIVICLHRNLYWKCSYKVKIMSPCTLLYITLHFMILYFKR